MLGHEVEWMRAQRGTVRSRTFRNRCSGHHQGVLHLSAEDAYEALQEILHAREAARAGAPIGGPDGPTLEELDALVEHAREAWVGAAVTEIASMRAMVHGPQVG